VEVSALPIAVFNPNWEHIAGIADTKAGLVGETDGEVQRAVINGVADEVHHLAMDFGIFPAQPCLPPRQPMAGTAFRPSSQILWMGFAVSNILTSELGSGQ